MLQRIAATSALLGGLIAGEAAFAQEPALAIPEVSATTLLSSAETIIGQSIAYPDGTAMVTAALVFVPAGAETGWHTHEVPLFAYILEGELTVDYGSEGTRTYSPGDSFLEAMN